MKENGVENRNGSAKSILHPRIALFLLCFSNSTVKDQPNIWAFLKHDGGY